MVAFVVFLSFLRNSPNRDEFPSFSNTQLSQDNFEALLIRFGFLSLLEACGLALAALLLANFSKVDTALQQVRQNFS